MYHFQKPAIRFLTAALAVGVGMTGAVPAFAADGNVFSASTAAASSSSAAPASTAASAVITSVTADYEGQTVNLTAQPDTVLEVPRLSLLCFKVRSSSAVRYSAGSGSIASTGTRVPYSSTAGEATYTVTAIGPVGSSSGLFVDGKKIFAIKIGASPFVCDTSTTVSKAIGSSYTFKVTAANLTDKVSFHVGTGKVAATAAQPVRTENGKHAYYFKLTASAAGRTGVFITVNGVSYYVFDFVSTAQQTPGTAQPFTCTASGSVTKNVGESYAFQVTAASSAALSFTVGNGSVLSTSVTGRTAVGSNTQYSLQVTARAAGKTGVYITTGGKAYQAFVVTVQSAASAQKYAVLTGDGVNLRSGPGTNYSVLELLAKGAVFQVLNVGSEWTQVQTESGKTGYVSTQFLEFTSQPGTSADSLTLTKTTGTFAAGKSMYIVANVSPTNSFVQWTSSNDAVAQVKTDGNYCYIYGVAPGTATVTAASGGHSASCAVTVTAADAVRMTYASPNVVTAGQSVTLYATTDTTRTGVQFQVEGKTYSADLVRTDTTGDVSTKVWKAAVSSLSQGIHTYTAVSKTDGDYSAAGVDGSIFVSAAQDASVTTQEDHRASDAMLNFLADKEGYAASPYRDRLTVNQVPTTGYGMVLYNGDVFYNNMSETEAWCAMVNDLNSTTSSYTTAVNALRSKNNLWMSQAQADALISVAYNIGPAYFTDLSLECTFRDVMLNAVVPPTDASASKSYKAKLTDESMLYSAAESTSSQGSYSAGTALQVIGVSDGSKYTRAHKNVWYQVQIGGKTGWMNSAYVHIDDSYNLKRDLSYTNADVFGSELSRWCHTKASGVVAGLLYRRIQEANMYNYNDYNMDLAYAQRNPYGYTVPSVNN